MRYVVVTRFYVNADSAKQAHDIVRVELPGLNYRVYPYVHGIEQYDCDCEEVLTEREFAENDQRKSKTNN